MTIENNNNNQGNFYDELLAEYEKEQTTIQNIREKMRAERANIMKNDTVYTVISTSRGYETVMLGSMDGKVQEKPGIKKSDENNATKGLDGVYAALKSIHEKNLGKKHIVLYVNDREARRISGMLGRINDMKEDDETMTVFTPKELEFISAHPLMYGANYVNAGKNVFMALVKIKKEGYIVRVVSLDSLFGYKVTRNLPADVANKEVVLTNGRGVVTFEGRNYQFALANNLRLNGKHKLVLENSTIVVERQIAEGTEHAFVRKLFTIATLATNHKATYDEASAYDPNLVVG